MNFSIESEEDRLQLEAITEALVSLANMDFSVKLPMRGKGALDAVCVGLMALAEEMSVAVAARERAQRSSDIKTDFLAVLSHEMKTPLTAIIGCEEVLSQASMNPKEMKVLGHLSQAAEQLEGFIGKVVDFSNLQDGTLLLEDTPFELGGVLQEVFGLLNPMAETKNLQLVVVRESPEDLVVRGDKVRLKQVLHGLVTNAINFTVSGQIRFGYTVHSPGSVQLWVEDTGLTVIPNSERIFHKLTIGEGVLRNQLGMGLELSIVQALVERMGGAVVHRELKTPGARFEVSLRLPPVDVSSEAGPAPAQKGVPHVLVVDDTEVIRLVLSDMLVTLGCTVEAFKSGEAVLEHIMGGAQFDLIMMDCQMPQMDGLETTRRVLDGQPERNIKVVAISAHATATDRSEQRAAGMVEHLNKPFRLKELQALLNRVS